MNHNTSCESIFGPQQIQTFYNLGLLINKGTGLNRFELDPFEV